MIRYQFKNPKFISSAAKKNGYPKLLNPSGAPLSEIAVAGRSNVGKSSLLNDLFQSPGLVKTSSVPGKTQLLNFFTLNNVLVFVDLPGYGYAKVPLHVRKQWGPMIQEYLDHRPNLKLILFLFDIRRLPSEEDFKLLEWASHQNKSLILVLTKVDKVSANQRRANLQKILDAFNCENLHHVYYSTVKNVGRKELMAKINDALNEEEGTIE